jgi:hypothetical protein
MRRVLCGVITVAALCTGALSLPAGASGGFRVVRVSSTSTSSQPVVTGTPACDPAGDCLASYTVTADLSGAMQGTLVNDGTAWLASGSSTFHVAIIGLFTGSVAGCGEGTMALSYPLTVGGSAPFSGQIDVVAGSGTGAFERASGTGTYTFDPSTRTSQSSLQVKCRAA